MTLSTALLLAGTLAELGAQEVVLRTRGHGHPRANAVLREVLERGDYLVIAYDSILGPEQRIDRDVIVVDASLRVEGRIGGDLVGVRSDIFARPSGRFDGQVAILGGGFYGSSLASMRAPAINAGSHDYRVQLQNDGVYVVTAPGAAARFALPGLYGFGMPSYDRVNALTLSWGFDFERGASRWLPDAEARVRYRSVREDVDSDLELRWWIERHSLVARGGRTVRTNDDWINANVENSLYAIVAAIDTRNYYEADFADLEGRLEFGTGTVWWTGFRVGWERARTLESRDPFSIFAARGGFQPNLPVEPGEAGTVGGEAGLEAWIGPDGPLRLSIEIEHADADLAGNLSFTLLGGRFSTELSVGATHALLLEARGQLPLRSGTPGQRWRSLGGWGSLPTLRPVGRSGDLMWWASATYRLPLRPTASFLTRMDAWLQYAAGNAWLDGEPRPATVHDVGVGLSIGPLAAALYTDPSADFKSVLAIGIDAWRR